MDKRQWEALQLNAQNDHKRPWNPASTAAEFSTVGSGPSTEQEDYELAEWKRRLHIPQVQGVHEWDTSVQTSLWLAQQNRLTPAAPMSRKEESGQSIQARESDQGYSGDDGLVPSSRQSWAPTTDGLNLSDEQSLHAASTSVRLGKYCEKVHHGQGGRKDDHGTAAPRPRKPATISRIEQRCEKCLHGQLYLRDAVCNLNKLAESLNSATLSRQDSILHDQAPHTADIHRILDLVQEANELARQVFQAVPSLQNARNGSPSTDRQTEDIQASMETMKRKFLSDPNDACKKPRQPSEHNLSLDLRDYPSSGYESAGYSKSPRRPSIVGLGGSDRLPPIRTHSPAQPSPDAFGITLPSMKPPPTPGRQLPSPPGRSHPSPPSYNIPSPTSIFHLQSVSSTSVPHPSSSLPNIHHPLSPAPSSSLGATATAGAVQAHTAALQHEVSAKKYALKSLQAEHDELMAAYRRSQTRARALEDKAVTSDLEINLLAEERVRLLAQITELEQSVSDISKARDEFRQATVKEGAQYVKMVSMASRLEMVAAEERREWTRKLNESEEARAQAYQKGLRAGQAAAVGSVANQIDQGSGQTSQDQESPDASTEDLKREVQRLRVRCSRFAATLQRIRCEARRVGEAFATLGSSGERILRDVNGVLTDGEPSHPPDTDGEGSS